MSDLLLLQIVSLLLLLCHLLVLLLRLFTESVPALGALSYEQVLLQVLRSHLLAQGALDVLKEEREGCLGFLQHGLVLLGFFFNAVVHRRVLVNCLKGLLLDLLEVNIFRHYKVN